MRLYHRTPAGAQIVREGFRDGSGSYGLATHSLRGVFVSDVPLDDNEGAEGSDLLEVTLADGIDLAEFEIIEQPGAYREWCVPAALLNRGRVRLLTAAEADEAAFPLDR